MTSDAKIPDYQRIWLQPFAGDEGGHTWCSERIEDDDIEYIRLDLHEAALLAAEQRGRKAGLEEASEYAYRYMSHRGCDEAKFGWDMKALSIRIRSLGEQQ